MIRCTPCSGLANSGHPLSHLVGYFPPQWSGPTVRLTGGFQTRPRQNWSLGIADEEQKEEKYSFEKEAIIAAGYAKMANACVQRQIQAFLNLLFYDNMLLRMPCPHAYQVL